MLNKRPRGLRQSPSGFSLIELLVVISIIAILAALLLPTLARSKQRAQGIYCLNNGKQMMTAVTMYTSENHDFFPPNPDDGNTIPGHNWCSGSAGVGWPDEFNSDLLKDPTRTLIAPYLGGNISVFHCPGDKRMGSYSGTDPTLLGHKVSAARTFSMNQAVGTICAGFDSSHTHSGPPNLAVNGPWLNNNQNHRRDSPWITYGRMSDIRAPGPSMLWVLVDEDIHNLNDAAFAFGMEQPIWYDAPGTYHNGGCGFAFADGHSESHMWKSRSEKLGHQFHIIDPADREDWLWMRVRTSANVNGTMPPPP